VRFEKNKISLNLKFKSYNISCMVQTHKDSIQGFKIHSELLFRYCSYYSDTRGVTIIASLAQRGDKGEKEGCSRFGGSA
jgi:hypothetical protein